MTKISATIITRNEQSRIDQCLRSLQGVADEIIVVDSFSTDDTADICRKNGCNVSQRQFHGYGAQRQYATSLTSHRYVLAIDADEVLSPALRKNLMKLKSEGFTHRVYAFSRLNFYCGTPVRHSGWYPDLQTRLFDKSYASWNLRDVREKVVFPDSVRPCLVEGDILHYRCDTPADYHRTQALQAAIRGRVLAANNDSISPIAPFINGFRDFIGCFIGRGAILDGAEGRAISRECFRSTVISYRLARRILKNKHH